MTTVSLGGSLLLDGLRLVGMSKRESLLENEKNVAMKLAKVTPHQDATCLGGHTQDVSFPGVALRLSPMHTLLLEDWQLVKNIMKVPNSHFWD